MYHVTLALVPCLDGVLLHHAVKVSLLLAQLDHKAVMRVHVLQLRQIPVGHLKVGFISPASHFPQTIIPLAVCLDAGPAQSC